MKWNCVRARLKSALVFVVSITYSSVWHIIGINKYLMKNDIEKEEKYLGFHLKNQHIHMPGLFANIFIMDPCPVL